MVTICFKSFFFYQILKINPFFFVFYNLQLQLKPGDGELPDVPGPFTSVKVRGVPLFLDARFFNDVYHYKRIMGFDRPIDFKLKDDSDLPKKE